MQHRSMTWKNIEDNSKVEDVKNGFIVDTSCDSQLLFLVFVSFLKRNLLF